MVSPLQEHSPANNCTLRVLQEVALIGMTAYLSYLMGDVLHLSGILSLFVSAVFISHYALHNISLESRTTTIYSFQTLSYISEAIIFIYCGMDALDPLKWKVGVTYSTCTIACNLSVKCESIHNSLL